MNLLFDDHVALLGREITGFNRTNLDKLWVDPFDYKDSVSEAIHVLNSYGISASVYNHQLCIINNDVKGNYKKSISDWKNEYLDTCFGCTRMAECGGFFSSSKLYRHSEHIRPTRHYYQYFFDVFDLQPTNSKSDIDLILLYIITKFSKNFLVKHNLSHPAQKPQ